MHNASIGDFNWDGFKNDNFIICLFISTPHVKKMPLITIPSVYFFQHFLANPLDRLILINSTQKKKNV